jgi:hypothetical protein
MRKDFSEHLRHLGQYLSHLKGELGGWVQRAFTTVFMILFNFSMGVLS